MSLAAFILGNGGSFEHVDHCWLFLGDEVNIRTVWTVAIIQVLI